MSVASLVLAALTTYLLLDRNHAEELGAGTRIAFDTRMCRRSPRSQSWYTVARHTPNRFATVWCHDVGGEIAPGHR
jgi:hypothetical protein